MIRAGSSVRRNIARSSGGNAPKLDLLFTSGVLDSRVTFSRASTATYFDATGTLQTASSGVARFDYSPSTLALNGLLIEEARTNLLLQSNTFNVTWGLGNATVSAAAGISPDGTNNAWKLAENNATAQHVTNQTPTYTANPYTLSVFAKAAERTFIGLEIFDGTNDKEAWFNLSNGTIGTVQSGVTATIQNIGNGWYRVSATFTTLSHVGGQAGIFTASADNTVSYLGTTGSGILIYGAQLEQASFPTSYIPTTTATVSRSADADSTPLAVGSAVSGVVSAITAPGASGTQVLWQVDDGTANNRVTVQRNSSSQIQLVVVTGGVTQATLTGAAIANSTAFKVGFRVQVSDYALTVNGAAVVTGSGTMPSGLVTHRIGTDTGSSNVWDGWIARDRAWIVPLSNSSLQGYAT